MGHCCHVEREHPEAVEVLCHCFSLTMAVERVSAWVRKLARLVWVAYHDLQVRDRAYFERAAWNNQVIFADVVMTWIEVEMQRGAEVKEGVEPGRRRSETAASGFWDWSSDLNTIRSSESLDLHWCTRFWDSIATL